MEAELLSVLVRRSAKRKKTVSWRVSGTTIEIALPARLSKKEEENWVARIRDKIRSQRTATAVKGDAELLTAAQRLMRKYFAPGLPLKGIAWSARQKRLYGSCTSADGTIRLAQRLQDVPSWVTDYVIVHELAHLVHPDHSPAFWMLVNRYPFAERARGFLLAMDLGLLAAGSEEL